MRLAVLLALILSAAGCFNGGNSNISLGDVSLGQQLIDLKRALEEDALTEAEYEAARESLMASMQLCENGDGNDGWF